MNDEFLSHLEYHLCRTFKNSSDEKIKVIWCDGILTPSQQDQLSKKSVNDRRKIEVIAFLGASGQERYEMTIYFGQSALHRYAKDLSLIDTIPSELSMNWINIDIDKFKIEVHLR